MVRDETTDRLSARDDDPARTVPALTIIGHADVRRVGDRVRLAELAREPIRVSRIEPAFSPPDGERPARPIDDSFVSRSPIVLRAEGDHVVIEATAGTTASINGEALVGRRRATPADLDDGITIELGPRVALLLHRLGPVASRGPALGLIGESSACDALRAAILRMADAKVPVLIRGETGTGKEVVARALHGVSGRTGPLVALNVAAIPPSTAASALFGHVRGAYTGATSDLVGHFREADRGSLFLDEIGEIPLDVQAALLRALEHDEIQPVGGARAVAVDVRVVAATDRDLDAAVAAGTFRTALLHRLSAFHIHVPPLRARRDDIGRLLVAFLREQLLALGRSEILDDADRRRPWLPAAVVAVLVRAAWPGNVRQLRNVARHFAVTHADDDEVRLDDSLRTSLGAVAHPAQNESGSPTTEQIVAVLEKHCYRIGAAAAELGVSRARMYKLAERIGGARTARDVSREEIEDVLAADADLDRAAAALRISPRALTLRMSELGIERR